MTSTDKYLAEKLKEILLRLYPKETSPRAATTVPTRPSPNFELNVETIVMKGKHVPHIRTEEEILADSLNEFIKVLKMSLSSNNQGVDDNFGQTFQYGQTQLPQTGTMANGEMDLNLSPADIADLNNMMIDSGETSIPLMHLFIIFSYLLISVVAIIGNLLVVQLVIKSRRLHTLTNVLLANLAVADLMMATINCPFSAARVILKEWPFGSFLCQVVPFLQVASVYAISYTMTVIALDRYQVIMNPLGRRMKSSKGIPIVSGIWALSIFLSIPYALHHQVVNVLTLGIVKRCQAEFDSIGSRQLLTVGTFLLQYFVPLSLTTLSYVSIMGRLGSRSTALGSTTPRQAEAQSRAKIKTIKMLVLTVIFFAVSWAPINAYHLLTHFGLVRHDSIAILISHVIAMSSCCYNPYIYCWLNEYFRLEASRCFRCFRTRRSPMIHPGVEVNGMLTRTDLVMRRNQSSIIHTTSLRSHLQTHHRFPPVELPSSSGCRPELIFITTTTSRSPSPPPPRANLIQQFESSTRINPPVLGSLAAKVEESNNEEEGLGGNVTCTLNAKETENDQTKR